MMLSSHITLNLQHPSTLWRNGLFYLFALIIAGTMTNAKAETIKLVTGEFPPYSGADSLELGIASDIITQVIQDMGYQTKIEFAPWKRGYVDTLHHKYLGTFPYSKNSKRLKTWYYSKPLYHLEEHFFSLSKNRFEYQKESDLNGKSICKPNGYNLFGLEKLVKAGTIKIVRPASMNNCFAMVVAGHVDLAMTNVTTGRSIMAKLNITPKTLHITERPYVNISHHLIIPKDQAGGSEFVQRFNLSLKKLNQEQNLTQNVMNQHLKKAIADTN